MISVQVAFTWQLSISSIHSFISVEKVPSARKSCHRRSYPVLQCVTTFTYTVKVYMIPWILFIAQILLVQLTPSPEKPALQVHSKLPKVLMQVAFSWQLSVPSVHSLTSIQNKTMHISASYTLFCYHLDICHKSNAVSNVHIPVQLNPSPVNPVLQLQL